MRIVKKLNDWVKHNLITAAQKQEIIEYEKDKVESSSLVFYGFLCLGGLAVGIGIISVIAANWNYIGPYFKLGVASLLLLGFAFAYLRYYKKGSFGFAEMFLFLFLFMCLGYIGLTAQIYHLYSMPHRGFLFWAVICAPLAFISKKPFFPFIWISVFLISIGIEVAQYDIFQEYIQILVHDVRIANIAILGLIFQLFLWLGGLRLFGRFEAFRPAYSLYFVLSLLSGLLWMDIMARDSFLRFSSYGIGNVQGANYTFLLTALVLMVGTWMVVPKKEKSFYYVVLLTFYLFLASASVVTFPPFLYAVLHIMALGFMAVHAAVHSRRWLFNVFAFLIGVRLIVLYIQAFGGLMATGIGLVVTGAVIIGTVAVWYKHRLKLESAIKEFLQ